MRTDKISRTGATLLRLSALAVPILWLACGSTSASRTAYQEPLQACLEYAAAMDRCLSATGADRQAVSRQVDAIKTAIDIRSTDPLAREQLKQSCTLALRRMTASCPAPTSPLPSSL